MLRVMAQDHFILYLMLMALMGLTLGVLGTLLIYVVLALHNVMSFMYTMFSVGWA